jgi:hypothetical protein
LNLFLLEIESRVNVNDNSSFLFAGSRTGGRHTLPTSAKYAKRRSPPYATLPLLLPGDAESGQKKTAL